MTTGIRIIICTLAVAVLAGCASGGDRSASANRASPRAADPVSAQTTTRAERACLRGVALEANNRDVILLKSARSPDGTEAILGVGPQRARWRCIGYNDGTTTVVISLAEEALL